LLVATLDRPFALRVPCESATAPLSAYLDPPDAAQDREDAERIARTIQGLRLHNARHQGAGHGFAFTVVDGTELRLPVNPKAYHKINTGPFVQTAFGPRLLRQSEIERIQLRKRSWLSCFCRQVIVGMGHATTDCSTGGSPAG
jgi:hypothetical protein